MDVPFRKTLCSFPSRSFPTTRFKEDWRDNAAANKALSTAEISLSAELRSYMLNRMLGFISPLLINLSTF